MDLLEREVEVRAAQGAGDAGEALEPHEHLRRKEPPHIMSRRSSAPRGRPASTTSGIWSSKVQAGPARG